MQEPVESQNLFMLTLYWEGLI